MERKPAQPRAQTLVCIQAPGGWLGGGGGGETGFIFLTFLPPKFPLFSEVSEKNVFLFCIRRETKPRKGGFGLVFHQTLLVKLFPAPPTEELTGSGTRVPS